MQELENKVSKKGSNQGSQAPGENQSAGLVDDTPPESEIQTPTKEGEKEPGMETAEREGENEKDAVEKAVEEMDNALTLDKDMEEDD